MSENPYENAVVQLEKCAQMMDLDADVLECLRYPKRVLLVYVPVEMDSGRVRIFKGFRSQHNDALGPFKGGIRYHPGVSLEEVMALSMWMTWKCSVSGLPYGGGKGGVICDPKKMSVGELERLSRGYFRAISRIVGPEWDIPAGDINTSGREMAWFMDEYSRLCGHNVLGAVTGKPISVGGSEGRVEATGKGVSIIGREAAKALGMDLGKARVVVQGIGNVGYYSAKFMEELGCKVVGISDSIEGIYSASGINLDSAASYKERNGCLKGFPGGEPVQNGELLEKECDILIPAALESQITIKNAGQIRAKLILEGANGPVTPDADEVLHQMGTIVVPDILTNAGGVIVSYFEWVQNLQNYYWSIEEVNEKLDRQLVTSFKGVHEAFQERGVDMRMAGYMVAVKRVADAMIARGWV